MIDERQIVVTEEFLQRKVEEWAAAPDEVKKSVDTWAELFLTWLAKELEVSQLQAARFFIFFNTRFPHVLKSLKESFEKWFSKLSQ